MRTGNTLTFGLVGLVIAVLLALFQSGHKVPSPIPLVISRVAVPYSGLLDIAAAKDFYIAQGLHVTFKEADTGPASINAVLSGEADIGTTAETPIANALVKGKPLAVIATIFRSETDPGIIARKDRGILQPSDLKGKRIATVPGTAAHYLLDLFLAFHKLSKDAVLVKEMTPNQLVPALVAGDVDAVAIWNPHFLNAVHQLADNGLVFPTRDIYSFPFSLVVRQNDMAEQREAVDRLLRALLEAETFVNTHSDEAIQIIASATGSRAQDIASQWNPLSYELNLNQSLLLAIENESRWILKQGSVAGGTMPDVLNAIETAPLRQIKPSSVNLGQ